MDLLNWRRCRSQNDGCWRGWRGPQRSEKGPPGMRKHGWIGGKGGKYRSTPWVKVRYGLATRATRANCASFCRGKQHRCHLQDRNREAESHYPSSPDCTYPSLNGAHEESAWQVYHHAKMPCCLACGWRWWQCRCQRRTQSGWDEDNVMLFESSLASTHTI